jgi:hypothetical protein
MTQEQLPLAEPLSVAEIDALEVKCSAFIDERAAQGHELRPGVPPGSQRNSLMSGHQNVFHAARALLMRPADE